MMAVNIPSERDLEVWRLKKGGLGTSEIGRRMGISKQLAHVAFKRAERLLQDGSPPISKRARAAIEFLTGSANPTLPDLRRSMIWWNEKGGWACHLRSRKGFAKRTADEVAEFCRGNGIEEGIISPARPQERKWERSEPPPDRERVSASHMLAVNLSARAVSALERVLGQYPTLNDLRDFVEGNRNWRKDLLGLRNCGWTSVREIEELARKCGIRT